MVEVAGRTVLCVGGGPVATGKVVPLAAAGARLVVISPTCTDELAAVADAWHRRPFGPEDVAGDPPPVLVVAGTGVPVVDHAVADAAAGRGLLCLRIDGQGSVAVPSVIRRESLVVALSTGAPALTKRLREHLEDTLDARWATAAATLSALREDPAVRTALAALPPPERRARWTAAVDAALSGSADPRSALLHP